MITDHFYSLSLSGCFLKPLSVEKGSEKNVPPLPKGAN